MRVFLSSCQKTRQSQCRIGGHLGYISAEYILRAFADVKGPGLVMELGAPVMTMDNSMAISFIFPPIHNASLPRVEYPYSYLQAGVIFG